MTDVIGFPRRPTDLKLTKKRLALVIGRTPRWIEMRMRDAGFPHHRRGRFVEFSLDEVTAWWDAHEPVPFDTRPLTPEQKRIEPAPSAPEPRRVGVSELRTYTDAWIAGVQRDAHALLALVGGDGGSARAVVDHALDVLASGMRAAFIEGETPSDDPDAA